MASANKQEEITPEHVRKTLVKSTKLLADNLSPDNILLVLLSEEAMAEDDVIKIEHEITNTDRVKTLLRILARKPVSSYKVFMKALCKERTDLYKGVKANENRCTNVPANGFRAQVEINGKPCLFREVYPQQTPLAEQITYRRSGNTMTRILTMPPTPWPFPSKPNPNSESLALTKDASSKPDDSKPSSSNPPPKMLTLSGSIPLSSFKPTKSTRPVNSRPNLENQPLLKGASCQQDASKLTSKNTPPKIQVTGSTTPRTSKPVLTISDNSKPNLGNQQLITGDSCQQDASKQSSKNPPPKIQKVTGSISSRTSKPVLTILDNSKPNLGNQQLITGASCQQDASKQSSKKPPPKIQVTGSISPRTSKPVLTISDNSKPNLGSQQLITGASCQQDASKQSSKNPPPKIQKVTGSISPRTSKPVRTISDNSKTNLGNQQLITDTSPKTDNSKPNLKILPVDEFTLTASNATTTPKPNFTPADNSSSNSKNSTVPNEYDVMISYQRDALQRMTLLKEKLEANEVNVWMDIAETEADMSKRMTDGVLRSKVILICFSKKYEHSENCQKEASYADIIKKKIIPLRYEDYKPSGWLGLLLEDLHSFDVSSDHALSTNFNAIVKTIKLSKDQQTMVQPS